MCEWCCNIPVNNPPKNKRSYFGVRRYVFCLIVSWLSFACLFVSFVTPYWIQSWPRVHTPFKRVGLWEYCLNGYMDRLDRQTISYFDCWWILSPYVAKPFAYLVPFWFIIIQVLMTISIVLQLAIHILLIVHLLKGIQRIERRAFVLKIIAIGHGITVLLLFPTIVIFGANWDNPNWLPYPNLNWPSWSYGLAVLSCILSFLCCFLFFFVIQENDHRTEEALMTFPMNIPTNQVSRTKFNLATSQTALAFSGDPIKSQPEKIPLIGQNYGPGGGSILSGSVGGSVPGQDGNGYYKPRQPDYRDEEDGASFVSQSNRSNPRNDREYANDYQRQPRYQSPEEIGSNLSYGSQNPYASRDNRGRQGGYYDDKNRRLYLERPDMNYGSEMSA